MKTIITFFILFAVLNAKAQKNFQEKINGIGSINTRMITLSDGSYVIMSDYNIDDYDFSVSKFSSSNVRQWQIVVDVAAGIDFPTDLIATRDSGFVVCGYSSLNDIYNNAFVVKINKKGKLLWSKSYGGFYDEKAYAVTETRDGGFAVTGTSTSFGAGRKYKIYVLKLNSSGNSQWQKVISIKQGSLAIGRSIAQTTDGGYVLTGNVSGQYSFNTFLLRLNKSGNAKFLKQFTTYEEGLTAIATTDGGSVITSFNTNNYEVGGMHIIKSDSAGNTVWARILVGLDTYLTNNSVPMRSVLQAPDKGFLMAGFSGINNGEGEPDLCAAKFDGNGNFKWCRRFYFEGLQSTTSASGVYANKNGFYIYTAGFDYTLVNYSAHNNYCGATDFPVSVIDATSTSGGDLKNIVSVDTTSGSDNISRSASITITPDIDVLCSNEILPVVSEKYNGTTADNMNSTLLKVTISPNPVTDILHFTVNGRGGVIHASVVDMQGRTILANTINSSSSLDYKMNISVLANGRYYLKINNGNEQQVVGFIKQR